MVALTVCGAAAAALPLEEATYEAHLHSYSGVDYHVTVETRGNPRVARSVVLYSQACGRTINVSDVEISGDGRIEAQGAIPAVEGQQPGTWSLDVRFTTPKRMQGSFRMRTRGCDSGVLRIDGRTGGFVEAPPGYPELSLASRRERAEAARLWRDVKHEAGKRFPRFARAHAAGFRPREAQYRRPLLFHVRSRRFAHDGRILDAERPESLVYWWPRSGEPVLIAYMFRAPASRRPAFGGPIPPYHRHVVRDGRVGKTMMTHVWLTNDLATAWANCLPVEALEAAIPRFRYSEPMGGASFGESVPCDPSLNPNLEPGAGTGETLSIDVGDNWFVRSDGVPTVEVERGSVVDWRFIGRSPHNVEVEDGPVKFRSPIYTSGSYRRTMSVAGAYELFCSVHGAPDQRMKLVVR